MTQKFTISAHKRDTSNKSLRKELKRDGKVLGVVYGHGFDPIALYFEPSDILRVYRKAGQSALIEMDLDGKKMPIILKEVKLDPVKNTISHIDAFALNLKEKTIVQVPIEFEGESPAVKNYGGIFTANHNSIEVRCLPGDMPEKFVIDISKLGNIHDHVCVKDIELDANKIEIMHIEPEVVICMIAGKGGASEEAEEEASAEGLAPAEEEKAE
ncbi:50S ribosomal protein L25 [Candidatus Gracilibacteria bacterium]|nr:50S ribosomal protein L25 [Candidatus Gracilibacteria bacterium]